MDSFDIQMMIFHFPASVEELDATDSGELEQLFTRLVDADRHGRHFFVAARDVCEWAVENLQLSGHDGEHLQRVQEEYTVRYSLVDCSGVYVKIIIGNSVVVFEGERVFSIGHRRLLENDYLSSKVSLVVEDMDADGRFYEHLLAEALRVGDVPSHSFEIIHGGGSRVPRVFDAEIERGRVAVCLVDNDKSAPMDQPSKSSANVIRIWKTRNGDEDSGEDCFIGIAVTTLGREAENYIPYHLLRDIGDYRRSRDFRELDRIAEEEGEVEFLEGFWKYFDVKQGVNGGHLAHKLANGTVSKEVVCWIAQKCGCESENVEELEIEGFGERVIDVFLNSPEALRGFHQFVRSNIWQKLYQEYFEGVLWYLAAPRPVRT